MTDCNINTEIECTNKKKENKIVIYPKFKEREKEDGTKEVVFNGTNFTVSTEPCNRMVIPIREQHKDWPVYTKFTAFYTEVEDKQNEKKTPVIMVHIPAGLLVQCQQYGGFRVTHRLEVELEYTLDVTDHYTITFDQVSETTNQSTSS